MVKMVRKVKLPPIELHAPKSSKKNLSSDLVERSELPKEFKDFNRFDERNQSMYKNPFKKSR